MFCITCITTDLLKIKQSIDSNLWTSTKTGGTLFLSPVLQGEEEDPRYRIRGPPKPLSFKQQDMLLMANKLQNDVDWCGEVSILNSLESVGYNLISSENELKYLRRRDLPSLPIM